jgi:hypothetical protein
VQVVQTYGGWTTTGWHANTYQTIKDIAFCNKNLYGLADCELYRFDIGANENGAPAVTSVHRVDLEEEILRLWCWESHETYIFQLHGNPAIAMKFLSTKECCNKGQFFRVFELVDSGRCVWAEATSCLADHALFLGPACSKAVRVPVIGGRGGVERNRIYYSEQQLCWHHKTKCLERLNLGSYTIYYYGKSDGVDPTQRIVKWGYHNNGHKDGSNGCIWILPPDF